MPVTALTRSFLCDLLRSGDKLTASAAERMTSVGIDLVAASLAESMNLEPPKALYGTLIVQRAKIYIVENLADQSLTPSQVAAALGVSLRRLQILFRDHGRSIADWIWQRRLEQAEQRLSDPVNLHVSLGDIAASCGFADQSHFSRRFRDSYDMTPREYRQIKLAKYIQY